MRASSFVSGPGSRISRLALAGAVLIAASGAASAADDTAFLAFPMATEISAAHVPAFAWTVQQGDRTQLLAARGPDFKRTALFEQSDVDGAPITGIRISPNGAWVAFTTGFAAGGYNPASLLTPPKATLWLVSAAGGAAPVRIGEGSGPDFSPDGSRLVYRSGADLWAVNVGAAEPKPELLVRGGAAFAQPVWTADGKSLIFVQDRGGWSFLGRYTLGSDRVEWLVTGADRLSHPVLSPDGRTVAYLRWPGREHTVTYDNLENQPVSVETVATSGGKARTLWSSGPRGGSRISDDDEGLLRWSDSRTVVFRAEEDGWARLYAVSAAGGAARALTGEKCEVAESELAAPDTLFVIHNCRDLDTRQASLITVSTGREQAVETKDAVLALASAAGDGRHVAMTGAGADASAMLRIVDAASAKVAYAETPADYGYRYGFAAPAPQQVRLTAADGESVPGQLFLPKGKGPHPALVYVHGGPTRQMFPAFHFSGYYANDYAMNRRLAEMGYVVLALNYRSGVGYGRDFREAPGRGWRKASEYADVLGAGRWLAARADVDPKRIGIWGGSYGGLLTGQALARDSDLFAAGVAIHGVFDWSWPSPVPGHLNPSKFFGVGEADKAAALAASPLGAVEGWRSPVLLFSGDNDMNVDVRETVDLAQKLRRQGVDVRTVLLPGESHGLIRFSAWQRLWRDQAAFFDETLGKR
ncbi:MAG: S9 family peptidase [Sphingomonadaceae bacterium]|nr:S9 family peptidase [Sphingomonadaceae bacterium]